MKSNPRISCQLYPIEKNKDMALFDLQTVAFWVCKNATSIALISLVAWMRICWNLSYTINHV